MNRFNCINSDKRYTVLLKVEDLSLILTYLYVCMHICSICMCGVFREQEILHHDDDLESFYSSFVALATHYICVGICSCTYSMHCICLSVIFIALCLTFHIILNLKAMTCTGNIQSITSAF